MEPFESWKEFVKRKGLNEIKEIFLKDVTRKVIHVYLREAFVYQKQHNHDNKYFTVERLKYLRYIGKKEDMANPKSAKKGNIEYRFCYYIVARNRCWWWGQYCPMIPKEDYQKLMKKVKKEVEVK
ncbi:MAG TPA: hypothetical protein VJB10_05050 [Candidatus Peribacteraceae bacterium]|nr:hypothetical protein [Candidatus Peribacteraceae bacterium]